MQFTVSFCVKSVFRRPKTAKISRPAGAVSRGLWGGRWGRSRPRPPEGAPPLGKHPRRVLSTGRLPGLRWRCTCRCTCTCTCIRCDPFAFRLYRFYKSRTTKGYAAYSAQYTLGSPGRVPRVRIRSLGFASRALSRLLSRLIERFLAADGQNALGTKVSQKPKYSSSFLPCQSLQILSIACMFSSGCQAARPDVAQKRVACKVSLVQ